MNKLPLKAVLAWSVILSVLANVFLARWITAKISILPVLNRFHLLSPQSPIVIKETIQTRVSSEGEVSQGLEQLRTRVSQVGVLNRGSFEILGSALNFTSDGVFVTSAAVMPQKVAILQIRLRDGKIAEVRKLYSDKGSGLVFLKTDLGRVLAADLTESQKLKLGDRLLLFADYPVGLKYFETQVNFLPEKPTESFGFQNAGVEIVPGMVLGNLKGEVLGIWHNRTVTYEQIKTAFANYLQSLELNSKSQ
ncbi:MAG: hypothetical protein HYZ51_00150 [Candidatus Doudnabacteria bacterium]|nr:hypothetical protein [Candidatus Doudnabacteria bacterium]